MPDAPTQPSPALDQYATWRPRLKRGVTWAGTTAFLAKTMGGDKNPVARIAVPTVLAGLAGTADATLEEKIRRNANLREVHMRGFSKDAAAQDPRVVSPEVVQRVEEGTNSVLGRLFAHKDEVGRRARTQLGALFPKGAGPESYGRVARLQPGGALSAMLGSIQTRCR